MGLFSDKKTIQVASTVYNMAGEEKDRPQFLQGLIIRNILSGTKESLGDSIRNGYLNGPAMRLRQFFRWARQSKNYGEIGMPTGQMGSGDEINPEAMEPYIPHPGGTEVWCQHALVSGADYSYWAEQWIMLNKPIHLDRAWVATYTASTNKILIRFTDNSTALFTPAGYNVHAQYIYAYYIIVSNPTNNLTISYSTDQLMIYRIGSGQPGLDKLAKAGSPYGEFFPFIPVRLDNRFISSTHKADAYAQVKKAYQKATGGHFDELVDSLKDNENLDDIDYAYVVFGVSLNVVEPACKRYLYTFFEKLMFSQINGPQAYQKWATAASAGSAIYDTWIVWKIKSDAYQQNPEQNPDPGPEPARPHIPEPPQNVIKIHSRSGTLDTDYDIRLNWQFIINGQGTGKGRPGAKTNDCWLVYTGIDYFVQKYYTMQSIYGTGNQSDMHRFRIYWQRSANAYTYIDVIGLKHKNEIYKGKTVTINAKEAIEDKEESGFIIPLHYETWRATPIIDSTQMGTACVYLVLNSYQVTRQKWYESTFFRIFLIIIIAVILAIVFPQGIGLLGSHLTVGTALGFTGMTAVIVGAVINAMAALVLTTILEKAATAFFGDLGPVIAAIFAIIIGNTISAMQSGTSMAVNWSTFLRADNLLALTEATGTALQKMIQRETLQATQAMEDLAKQTEEELQKVEEAFYAEFGYGKITIDPIDLFVDPKTIYAESPSSFLARTTLTGSDIAEMSQDMLSNFAEYSIKLPNAFT